MPIPKRRMKWVLPEVVDPSARKCYTVTVPNDINHIAAFMGAIYALSRPYSWGDDPDHTALAVGEVWAKIFDNLIAGDCTLGVGGDMQFRQSGCALEYSIDCVHWIVLYDPTDCIAGAGQPVGGGQPGSGECRSWRLSLQANGQTLLPVQVSAGDTIQITGATGGATDTTDPLLPTAWFCPSGAGYILGSCAGETTSPAANDPLQTVPHMRLIALVDGVFYDAFNTTITVPSGVDHANCIFLVNDEEPGDNAGSYSFNVEYCAELAPWCRQFDFTTDDQGWAASQDSAEYVAGTGWQHFNGTPAGDNLIISAPEQATPYHVTQVIVTLSEDLVGDNPICATAQNECSEAIEIQQASQTVYTFDTVFDTSDLCITVDPHYQGQQGEWIVPLIVSVEVSGTGVNPFGESNC